MSSAPFDTSLVIDRIKSATGVLAELREVGGAANYATVKALCDFPSPAVYVLLAREQGQQDAAAKSGRQAVTVSLGVAIAVRNYREERGVQSTPELNQFLSAVRERLIGWTPAVSGGRPLQFVQGDLVDYNDATLLWVDIYQTQHFIGGGTP